MRSLIKVTSGNAGNGSIF